LWSTPTQLGFHSTLISNPQSPIPNPYHIHPTTLNPQTQPPTPPTPPTPTPTPQPDDYAPNGIPSDVIAALNGAARAAGADASKPPAWEVEAECVYYSPTDDMVMEKVGGVGGWGWG